MDSRILFAEDVPSATLAGRVRSGRLVRLARGIYSDNVTDEPATIVHRHWREIVARRFPGAVVTDRSAVRGLPHNDLLFLASARDGSLELPGLTIVSRKGPGPVEGDIAVGAGIHMASRPSWWRAPCGGATRSWNR